MALQLVDIFGNLQPATGKVITNTNTSPITLYAFKDYTRPSYFSWILNKKQNAVESGESEIFAWNNIPDVKNKLLSEGYTQINESTFKKSISKKIDITWVFGNIVTQTYRERDDYYQNTYINIEETEIFKKYVGSKITCFYQFASQPEAYSDGKKILGQLVLFLSNYFKVQTFSDSDVNISNWESKLLSEETKFKNFVEVFNTSIKQAIEKGTIKKENIPSCFLPDPDPALSGPPTQAISGVTNKAPVVDNPNIKLPSQEVKSLTATSATDAIQQATPNVQVGPAITQAQGAASGAIGQAQGAASGAIGQAQDAASGAVSSVTDKLNPKGIKPDGLGKDWSPDKFSPESIAGNTKYVDPKTGQIGSTATLAKTLGATALGGGIGAGIGAIAGGGQGALIGGLSGGAIGAGAALGGIGGTALAGAGLGGGIGAVVGGGQGALIGAASGGIVGAAAAKLASVQKDMPKPNIPKPPNTPRIKTVKIPRPDSTKGAQALLNLPKSPTI